MLDIFVLVCVVSRATSVLSRSKDGKKTLRLEFSVTFEFTSTRGLSIETFVTEFVNFKRRLDTLMAFSELKMTA
jgi:hypothetical protein